MKKALILLTLILAAPVGTAHATYQKGSLFPNKLTLFNNTLEPITAHHNTISYALEPDETKDISLNNSGKVYFIKNNMFYTITYPLIDPSLPSTSLLTHVEVDIATLCWLSKTDAEGFDELQFTNNTLFPARIIHDNNDFSLSPYEQFSINVSYQRYNEFDTTKSLEDTVKVSQHGTTIPLHFARRVHNPCKLMYAKLKSAHLQLSTLLLMNPDKGYKIKAQPVRTVSPSLLRGMMKARL